MSGEFMGPDSEMGKILGDVFGFNIFEPNPNRHRHSYTPRAEPKREPKIRYDYPEPIDPETTQQILVMYAEGVAITDIENYFGMNVNGVIDRYAPFL